MDCLVRYRNLNLEKLNNKQKLNLSFDQEIQKLIISESLGNENSFITRSKSENQIGSFDLSGIPTYEQFHALNKPVQSMVSCPATSAFGSLSIKQGTSRSYMVKNDVIDNGISYLHSNSLVSKSEKRVCMNGRFGSKKNDLRIGLLFF